MSDSPLRDAPHTLCVYEATLLEVVQNEVWHCSAGINRGPPGKSITLMVAYVSPKLHHPPLHQWYLHTYEVIHAVDTDASQMLVFASFSDNSLDALVVSDT